MKDLTPTSRANFALSLGQETKEFIDRCDGFSMKLSDAADEEKSKPLRVCLHSMSERIDSIVRELNTLLGVQNS